MKENKYDEAEFYNKYSHMARSVNGLSAAGEWHVFRKLLPDFHDKRVLDLGCGFGWHCLYAAEQGARKITGIDISERMLAVAREKTPYTNIVYQQASIEDFIYEKNAYDIVLSSLAFHYIKCFDDICKKIQYSLTSPGSLVFSVEHPIFTAHGSQDWYYDQRGKRLHWPVDNYFFCGERDTVFLGEQVRKYHRTLTTYINTLIENGFRITSVIEPQPSSEHLASIPDMNDEKRRPMMLIIAAEK